MLNVITVRDFKQTEITRTVNFFLNYERIALLTCYKYVSMALLKHMSVQCLPSGRMQQPTVKYTSRKFTCWFDLLDLPLSSGLKKKKNNFFLGYKKVLLLFAVSKILILRAFSTKLVGLPNKSSVYTLLRSPHTDKKSREQYRKHEFRKLVHLSISRSFLLFIIKKELITSKIRGLSFLGK